MSTITVENLAKSFGEKEIFKEVSFRLETGNKAALVGKNGEGKTTILRCLLGLEEYNAGRINIDSSLKLGYAAQHGTIKGATLWEHLIASGIDVFTTKNKLQELEKLVSKEPDEKKLDCLLEQYANLQKRYEHLGGYTFEQEVRKVSFGLGFVEEDFNKNVANFSGGQKTRAFLASALLGNPDFLILDEPTNHLDISMTEWLEKYLVDFTGGLLIVSHDRYFLDRVIDRVFELQLGKLKTYKGNYSQYVAKKAQQEEALLNAYEKQQEHIQKTEDYIRKYKAGIKSKQARGRQSQLNRLERVETPQKVSSFGINLPKPSECADNILICENLTIGYENKVLFEGLQLLLRKGEKVALVGPNGIGKTTFLKTITGQMTPLHGRASIGNRVKIGYFSQEHADLFGPKTLLEEIVGNYDVLEAQARNLLGGMLFRGDDVLKRLDDLSGGERARLALLKLMLDGANFLILDEPTNHLDINAREIVEEVLFLWEGSLLLVSHDRYFLDKIAERIWEMSEGVLNDYLGNYSYYCEKKQELLEKQLENKIEPKEIKKVEKTTEKEVKIKKNIPQNIDRRLNSVELSIREQEALLKVLEQRLANPLEHLDVQMSENLAQEHKKLQNLIEKLMIEWEELSLQKENI